MGDNDKGLTLAQELRLQAVWYAYAVWFTVLEMWRDLPGPWWVKLLLVAVTVAIPGPQDELLLLAVIKVCRVWRKRQRASKARAAALAA